MKAFYAHFKARLVDAIIARAQRTPYHHLPGYMDRYWLVRPAWYTLGIAVRVHRILRSDLDRDMHTHPWWNVSLILRGRYTEIMPTRPDDPAGLLGGYVNVRELFRYTRRKPGHLVFRRRSSRHKLMLFSGPVWTLFIHGRDRNLGWGYHVPGIGLVDRHDYEGQNGVQE